MRLVSKLTSLELEAGRSTVSNEETDSTYETVSCKAAGQRTARARVLLPVLFLLAFVSCSVSKQPGIQNAAQQSDINGKTSPAIPSNAVTAKALPALSTLSPVQVQDLDILALFLAVERARAITLSPAGTVYLWDLSTQNAYQLLKLQGGPFEVATYNPAELLLAVARETDVRIYSVADGSEVARLKKLKTRAASLAFQPSGRSLVIGGADGEVYRWRFMEDKTATTPKEAEKFFERYFGHANVISSVAYHPVGRIFFSGDWSGALNAWLPYDADAFGGQYLENAFGANMFSDRSTRSKAVRVANSSIEHLRVSEDGNVLLSGTQDGTLEWWNVRGFTLAATVSAHKGLLYDIAIAPSGKVAATLGRDGRVRIWQLTRTVDKEAAKTTFAIEKSKEIDAPGVKKLIFLDETTLLLGDHTGRISFSKL
ncbi:MAG: hypothetical protein J0M12_11070 [Deltaproteobacteria bacterium]|nr:hypothetical protein [Deltaproteobacteria bacterium]